MITEHPTRSVFNKCVSLSCDCSYRGFKSVLVMSPRDHVPPGMSLPHGRWDEGESTLCPSGSLWDTAGHPERQIQGVDSQSEPHDGVHPLPADSPRQREPRAVIPAGLRLQDAHNTPRTSPGPAPSAGKALPQDPAPLLTLINPSFNLPIQGERDPCALGSPMALRTLTKPNCAPISRDNSCLWLRTVGIPSQPRDQRECHPLPV